MKERPPRRHHVRPSRSRRGLRQVEGGDRGGNNWDVKGPVNFIGSKDGYAAHIKATEPLQRAVVTGVIDAAPDADSVGEGEATLRIPTGPPSPTATT